MNARKLIAKLMELILLLSVILALAGAVFTSLGDGFEDKPVNLVALLSTGLNNSAFFGLAVLLLLCAPLIVSLASAIYFWKEHKRGMALIALLLFLILTVTSITHG